MTRRLAVVVIFRERTAFVDECLRALLALEGGPWPIVLVPDAFVPAYAGLAVQAPRAGGLSAKRNAGAAACPQGCDLIAFTDSDAAPRADWARRAAAAIDAAGPGTAILTGPNRTPPGDPWSRRACGAALESPLVMGPGARMFSGGGRPGPVRKAYACNLVVRRAALADIGGFDESARCEDVALCEAALSRGLGIRYDPELVVWHHRRGPRGFLMQWFNEALSLREYLRYPRAGGRLVFLPSALLLLEAALLAAGACRALLLLESAQAGAFFAERLLRLRRPLPAAGAALAMWGFLKAYGAGGLAGLFWRPGGVLASRRDPPAPAEFLAAQP